MKNEEKKSQMVEGCVYRVFSIDFGNGLLEDTQTARKAKYLETHAHTHTHSLTN